jgi:hypothetical protein
LINLGWNFISYDNLLKKSVGVNKSKIRIGLPLYTDFGILIEHVSTSKFLFRLYL